MIRKRILYVILCIFFQNIQAQIKNDFVLVIHGGAGTIRFDPANPGKQKKYETELQNALQIGYDTLNKNGTALDAVETVVRYLEDCPLFNAGKGAVFTSKGTNELDAAIMDGSNLKAGAIAGVTIIKNPVSTARAVMEKSNHVMLIGKGAEEFAKENKQTLVDQKYFYTEERWNALQKAKAEEAKTKKEKTVKMELPVENQSTSLKDTENKDYKYGTVGAVALDKFGNLAAATSTGGMTNKKFGRVGDVPVIGAGTYANNAGCAISCTGWGEFFIRLVMAKSVSDLIEFKGLSIDSAANEMIHHQLPALGGDGGLIGLDKNGNITMQFNTEGMYRGYIKSTGEKMVAVFKQN
jgi:beta-aspartyl-peptidase (threonine type)